MENCSIATELFDEKLTNLYLEKINPNVNRNDVKQRIKEWLTDGKPSEFVDKLLSVDIAKNFPIWWSGFYLEDNTSNNPVNDMKNAAKMLNGFSSLDTLMSSALTEQNKFWNECSKVDNFQWGRYISENYTKLALRTSPENIGLFLNKQLDAFLKSDFFNTEINLINNHYKDLGKHVTLHIFNLKDNCDDIINKLREYTTNVDFKCYPKCTDLTSCVEPMKRFGGRKTRKTKKTRRKIRKIRKIRKTRKTKTIRKTRKPKRIKPKQ